MDFIVLTRSPSPVSRSYVASCTPVVTQSQKKKKKIQSREHKDWRHGGWARSKQAEVSKVKCQSGGADFVGLAFFNSRSALKGVLLAYLYHHIRRAIDSLFFGLRLCLIHSFPLCISPSVFLARLCSWHHRPRTHPLLPPFFTIRAGAVEHR